MYMMGEINKQVDIFKQNIYQHIHSAQSNTKQKALSKKTRIFIFSF